MRRDTFPARLRRRRKKKGFTQRGLAAQAEVNHAIVWQYEEGMVKNPRGDIVAKLARALELTSEELLLGDAPSREGDNAAE
jgi:transcriptional regulator with XRE-family HTH domain